MANFTGTSGNDIVAGTSAADIMNSNHSTGTDIWSGGDGNDTYYVDSIDDVTVEADRAVNAAAGFDTVVSRAADYTLNSNVEYLTLDNSLVPVSIGGFTVFVRMGFNGTGNDLDNVIRGNDNDNTLSGLGGADWLYGNGGVDTINGDDGNDWLFGGTGNDTLHGGNDNDVLYGEDNDDTMYGDAGLDVFFGGGGNDTMVGGAGNDTFYVDDLGDVVVEGSVLTSVLPPGVDTVYASISEELDPNVENLTLTGITDLNGTGNASNNLIKGNVGNNVIDGKGGADTMEGSTGDDTYVVDNTGDVVNENAASGNDTVTSTITFTLTDVDVENLTLLGTSAINGTGNASDNTVNGNSASNTLKGLGGDDTIFGKNGDDTIQGGYGADRIHGGLGIDILRAVDNTLGVDDGVEDRFYFNTALDGTSNWDSIDKATFNTADGLDDELYLDGTIFTGLTMSAAGSLNEYYEGAGQTGNLVTDSRGIFLDTSSGALYYNPTFNVANDSVLFAVVNNAITGGSASLGSSDFTLY
jgi:Ca2+-binding RTX toxin-like protein